MYLTPKATDELADLVAVGYYRKANFILIVVHVQSTILDQVKRRHFSAYLSRFVILEISAVISLSVDGTRTMKYRSGCVFF